MKPLLKLRLIFFYCLIPFCVFAQIPVTLDNSTTHTIDRFSGLNGASTLDDNTKWANPDLVNALKKTMTGTLRYPGGTHANYWDWKKGWFIKTQNEDKCFTLEMDYQRRKALSNTTNYDGGDFILDFKRAIDATGAKPVFVLNPLTSDKYYQLAMLMNCAELNIPVERIEIGNEFYLDRCAYQEKFHSGANYGIIEKEWEDYIHHAIFPDVKISAVAAGVDAGNNPGQRRNDWNELLMNGLNFNLPEAFTFHYYQETGIKYDPLLQAKSLTSSDYPDVFGPAGTNQIVLNNFIAKTSNTIPVWLTEYNLFDKNNIKIHGTWYHGLFTAYTNLLFLENNRIQSSNLHAMAGSFVFADIFGTDNSLVGGGEFKDPDCTPFIPTKHHGFSAIGLTNNLIARATAGTDQATKLLFDLSSLGSPPDNLSDLRIPFYGWVFSKSSVTDGKKEVIILNLSDQNYTGLDLSAIQSSGIGNFKYDQLSYNSPEDYVTGELTNGIQIESCSGINYMNSISGTSISNATIDFPAFSITRIYYDNYQFTAEALKAKVCGGDDVTLIANGEPDWDYYWYNANTNFFLGNGRIIKLTGLATGLHDFVVYHGPQSTSNKFSNVSVEVKTEIHITVSSTGIYCVGEQLTLGASVTDGTGSSHFVWTATEGDDAIKGYNYGVGDGASIDVNPIRKTIYTVYAENGGCFAHYDLTVNPLGYLKLRPEYYFCTQTNAVGLNLDLVESDAIVAGTWSDGVTGSFTSDASTTNFNIPTTSSVQTFTFTLDDCPSISYSTKIITTDCCASSGLKFENNTKLHDLLEAASNSVTYYEHDNPVAGNTLDEGHTYTAEINGTNAAFDFTMNGQLDIVDEDPGDGMIDHLRFVNCNFQMGEHASIVVEPWYTLTFENCNIASCDKMWKGIISKAGTVIFEPKNSNGTFTTINDAEFAVDLKRGSEIQVRRTTFKNNVIGINGNDIATDGFNLLKLNIRNTIFNGQTSTFKSNFAGQSMPHYDLPFAGIRFNGVVGNIGQTNPLFTSNNVFRNLNNGIYAENSALNIIKTNFDSIFTDGAEFTDYEYYGLPTGSAIYNSCDNNYGSINFKGSGYYESPSSLSASLSFNHCVFGINVRNSGLTTNDAHFENVDIGISVSNNSNWPVKIRSNFINASLIGIDMQNNDGLSNVGILYNSIKISDGTAEGIAGIRLSENDVAFHNNFLISCNSIQTNNAGYGLFAQGVCGVQLIANNIYMNDNNSIKHRGINFSGGSRNGFLHNSVSGNTDVLAYKTSFLFSLSTENGFIENHSDQSHYGFDFQGDCYNTSLKAGKFNHHYSGLHLNSSGLIGRQINNGNYWNGPFDLIIGSDQIGAVNDNNSINPLEIRQSQFLVHLTNSANVGFHPNNFVSNSNFIDPWFVLDPTGNPFESSIFLYCWQIEELEKWTAGGILDSLIANDSIFSLDFQEELRWMTRQDLFDKLAMEDSIRNSNGLFQVFYQQYSDGCLDKLLTIKKSLDSLFNVKSEYINTGNSDLHLKLSLEKMDELSYAFDENPSDSLKQLYDQLYQNCLDQKIQLDKIMKDISDERELLANELLAVNATVDCIPLLGDNERVVNQIYLSTIFIGNLNFSNQDKNSLLDIAHQCPFEGGRAVYKARTLVNYFSPDEEYYDVQVCESQGYWRKAKFVEENGKNISVKLKGNPLVATSSFEFPFPTLESLLCEVSDLSGKSIIQFYIPEKSLSYSLVNLNLREGFYLYKFSSEHYSYTSGKLSVIK